MTLTLPLVFLAIVVIIVLAVLARSIVVVPRDRVFVISVLGRPTRGLSAGMHFVTPIVTTVAARVPVDEQTLEVPDTGGHLRDGTAMVVKGSIRYRVTNPLVAITDVADYRRALAEVAQTHWRRALETTSDVVRVDAALRTALPAIQSAAASWGIEAIDATTMMTMSEDGVRQLQQRAALEREQRVLAWLGERSESPGPDGRPTAAQLAAYKAWSEQLVAEHRDEIEAEAAARERPRF
jgi:regulator of protease activity HflC (stomatin/prohibitin superfamily)